MHFVGVGDGKAVRYSCMRKYGSGRNGRRVVDWVRGCAAGLVVVLKGRMIVEGARWQNVAGKVVHPSKLAVAVAVALLVVL